MKHYEACRGVVVWFLVMLITASCTPAVEQVPPVKHPSMARAAGNAGADTSVRANVRFDTTDQTAVQSTSLSRHQELTALFDAAYVDKDTFERSEIIYVRWPAALSRGGDMVIRIQTSSGRIYLEKQLMAEADTVASLGKAYLIPPGDYEIVLMPSLGEYYLNDVRVQRKIAITLLP